VIYIYTNRRSNKIVSVHRYGDIVSCQKESVELQLLHHIWKAWSQLVNFGCNSIDCKVNLCITAVRSYTFRRKIIHTAEIYHGQCTQLLCFIFRLHAIPALLYQTLFLLQLVTGYDL